MLRESIRTIADYPKPGIQFRDITTLLGDARAFRTAVDQLVQPWAGQRIDKVAGIEARGFILGGALAHQLSAGFIPVRKKGKLPHETVRLAYSLEYGVDEMEVHRDAVRPGERVILVDDLIATGGTATAAIGLLRQIGAEVVAACFVIAAVAWNSKHADNGFHGQRDAEFRHQVRAPLRLEPINQAVRRCEPIFCSSREMVLPTSHPCGSNAHENLERTESLRWHRP